MEKHAMRPYTKEDYKIHKLPYSHKAIDSPEIANTWLAFLDSILDGYVDKVSITMFLQEFIGHLFLPHTKFEKALLIYGS
jgi:phage/plasmid-associated DNA primase